MPKGERLALLATLLILNGCGGVPQDETSTTLTPDHILPSKVPVTLEITTPVITEPTPTEILQTVATATPEPFDYCVYKENNYGNGFDPYGAMAAGQKVDLEEQILFPQDTESLMNQAVDPENIVTNAIKDSSFNFLVIPVGYSEPVKLKDRMDKLIDYLDVQFSEVNVNFAYLNKSLPVGITRTDRLSHVTDSRDIDGIFSKLRQMGPAVYQPHSLIFVLNSSQYFGAGDWTLTVPGENQLSSGILAHDIGHKFRLTDKYEIFLGTAFTNSTEFITDTAHMDPIVREAYDIVKPPLFWNGNYCNGHRVLTFSDGPTPMSSLYDNLTFDPMETRIMNLYIQKILIP